MQVPCHCALPAAIVDIAARRRGTARLWCATAPSGSLGTPVRSTIVASLDVNFDRTVYRYRNGKRQPVNIAIASLGTSITGMNNAGVLVGFAAIEGTTSISWLAYRYDIASGATTILPPSQGSPFSWAMGINEAGDVVGYAWGPTSDEHVGIWPGSGGGFVEYFHEGTPQYTTVSNSLLFNDRSLIVITFTNDGNSYQVPAQGVRLPLSSLINYDASTQGLPTDMFGLNDAGALIGASSAGTDFLLLPQPGKQ